jgi:ubiquinone/menaquinone biosynthesis C-methylase UbiE
MERSQSKDVWTAGVFYEPYVGRWSRLVAKELLRWLLLPVGKDWLDVGCGTGALTQIILGDGLPNSVMGIDPSEGFVAYAKAQIVSARASFKIGDARALPIDSASFDAVVSGLVLNFVPEPRLAVAEIRVVRPGHSCGLCLGLCWKNAAYAIFLGCSNSS